MIGDANCGKIINNLFLTNNNQRLVVTMVAETEAALASHQCSKQ